MGKNRDNALIIIEKYEQAERLMKDETYRGYDVLPIDYNARAAMAGHEGRICSLLDFFDDSGHRYVVEKIKEKMEAMEKTLFSSIKGIYCDFITHIILCLSIWLTV